jgi:hypothetical protein
MTSNALTPNAPCANGTRINGLAVAASGLDQLEGVEVGAVILPPAADR